MNQWIFYSPGGQKMGVYKYDASAGWSELSTNVWFGGRLIADENGPVFQDRTRTNRAGGARFYPYGDEITSTANDHEKFATYTRDSYTRFDYADQRYYASTHGRFLTPDPFAGSMRLRSPLSWNRYSYTRGDPVNHADPRGLVETADCGGDDEDGCGGGGGDDGGDYNYVFDPATWNTIDSPVIGTATGTSCLNPNLVWEANTQECDAPIGNPIGAGVVQQVGQNATGMNQMIGGFAALAPIGGALVAGAIAAGGTVSLPAIFGEVPEGTFAGGTPSLQVAIEDIGVNRVTPTPINISGPWTTTEAITTGSQATSILALPPAGGAITSTAAGYLTSGVIPAGGAGYFGIAAPLFGQVGGGIQIWGAPVIWGVTRVLPWR